MVSVQMLVHKLMRELAINIRYFKLLFAIILKYTLIAFFIYY